MSIMEGHEWKGYECIHNILYNHCPETDNYRNISSLIYKDLDEILSICIGSQPNN